MIPKSSHIYNKSGRVHSKTQGAVNIAVPLIMFFSRSTPNDLTSRQRKEYIRTQL